MKVLFCVGFQIDLENEISGTGNWITTIIQNLKKHSSFDNLEVGVCMIDPKIKKTESALRNAIHVFKIPSLKGSKKRMLLANYGLLDPYLNLISDFKEVENLFKPNVVQIFGYESQFVRLFGQINTPILIHFQGFKLALNYKYFQRISKTELNKQITLKDVILGSIPYFNRKKSRITSYIDNFDLSLVQYVLGRTDWDRMVTKAVSPNASYFYCQEILREIFYNNVWVAPHNQIFQLFTITGVGSTKNVDLIFEVADLLHKYHSNFNFTWRIAGIDETSIIVKIMRRRGFKNDSIKLLGRLNSDEIVNEILNCNLYVYPSGMDNSPNALMEAMLVGAPVLSNYAGGISSIVEHGKTGVLVNEGEPFAMAGAIIEMASNKNLLVELGRNSRKMALQRNNPELIVKQLEYAFLKMLDFEN